MRFAITPLLAIVALAASCTPAPTPVAAAPAAATPVAPAAAQPPDTKDDAPTPYSAAEIRAASPAGRRIEHRVASPGKPATVSVMTFVASDEAGADVESVTLDETGHVVGTKTTGHATWEELRAHASFPRASVTITDETITVPAGTFDCRVYSVARPTGTMTFWFAKTLAGPPVRMIIRAGDKVVEERTLVRHLAR